MVTIAPSRDRTRILITSHDQDLMKAVLPAPEMAHPKAAATLLEGLALWYQQRLSVVLVVDKWERSSGGLYLCDALGYGTQTVHYDVGIAARNHRRAYRHIEGVGSFADLRNFTAEVIR